MKNIAKQSIALLFICTLIITISSCGLVQICIEKPRDIANATKYSDQRPLTAEGLKHLMKDDTTHYKVVTIYSRCCAACLEHMKYVDSKLWNADTAQVRWYFVLEDCSSLKYNNTKLLKSFGIETPYMYYLRDDTPQFSTLDEDRFLNIAKYIFPEETELEDVINGVPCTFVVDPQGKLKTEYRRYADGTIVVSNMEDLSSLIYKSYYPDLVQREEIGRVQDLDWNVRDTVNFSSYGAYTRKPKYCTPEGCF